MTLSELRALAASDSASTDPRRRKAGQYAGKAIGCLEKKDWQGAIVNLAHAITKRPEDYAAAFDIVRQSKSGSVATPAHIAAARANGKLGGRPRIHPPGYLPPLTRKPGETRGRKPKNRDVDPDKTFSRTMRIMDARREKGGAE